MSVNHHSMCDHSECQVYGCKDVPNQTFRIEVRFDFHGTKEGAEAKAQEVASSLGPSAEVTAILDEGWEEV